MKILTELIDSITLFFDKLWYPASYDGYSLVKCNPDTGFLTYKKGDETLEVNINGWYLTDEWETRWDNAKFRKEFKYSGMY